MAQVSACNHVFPKGTPKYNVCRERIRLYLGILKSHEPRWPLAKRSIRELRSVARQLLSTTMPHADVPRQIHPDIILPDQSTIEGQWDHEVFDDDDEMIALFLNHEASISEPAEMRLTE